MKIKSRIAFMGLLVFIHAFSFSRVYPQEEQQDATAPVKAKLSVFCDCEACDIDHMKKDIRFVSFVQEKDKAQVFIMVTAQKTESGDTEYTLSFRGQKEFEGDNDELRYQAAKNKGDEEKKRELVRNLKMGLMRYVGKTPASSRISVGFMDKVEPTAVEDKWNFWVFNLSGSVFLNGEKLYKDWMYHGSFSANRVTPEWKIRLSVSGMYHKNKFNFEDSVIESSSDSQDLKGVVVKSINDHWSVGAYFSAFSSAFTNVRLSLCPASAIEYNLFPYSESTKRQLRFLYILGFNSVKYREETIYEKTSENLLKESISITLEVKQKWGTASTSLEASHYFHDFSKNRIELSGDLSFRLVKGLNFNIDVNYSRIRNQLSLPRMGASIEEILLHRRELATTYNYYISTGLSYTFGSTQSKVVNPRFGDGGTSISISF